MCWFHLCKYVFSWNGLFNIKLTWPAGVNLKTYKTFILQQSIQRESEKKVILSYFPCFYSQACFSYLCIFKGLFWTFVSISLNCSQCLNVTSQIENLQNSQPPLTIFWFIFHITVDSIKGTLSSVEHNAKIYFETQKALNISNHTDIHCMSKNTFLKYLLCSTEDSHRHLEQHEGE